MDSTRPFHLELLYSTNNDKPNPKSWTTVSMKPCEKCAPLVCKDDSSFQATAVVSLKVSELFPENSSSDSRQISFAIQRRENVYDTWKPVRGPSGIAIGRIILASKLQPSIEQSINLDSGWSCQQGSTFERVSTWLIKSNETFSASSADENVYERTGLGSVNGLSRSMAITRIAPYWFGSEHTQEDFHLSDDAVLLSFLTTSGQTISLLAFNEQDDVYTVFKSAPDGSIIVCTRNDTADKISPQILAAVASDKQKSIAAVMALARQLRENSPKLKALTETAMIHISNTDSNDTSFLDNMGFCTWNGIGQDLTADKIWNALDIMKANGILPNTLIIDDNWQSLRTVTPSGKGHGARGWVRFEANENFPGGLKAFISEVKSKYPQIQYVGVWHALFGYWAGIAPNSDFEKDYKIRKIPTKWGYQEPTELLIIDPADIHRFFDDFYRFLSDCGIDFVKTDNQCASAQLSSQKDRAEVPSAYQSAWTAAYMKNFNGRAISCMSLVPQISFHSFLQHKTPKILLRNSDDFFPDIPGSHPFHLFINAHNALLTQHLNCIPDWDMFQTNHTYSSYHGAARAISGGPVLITDEPGKHDTKLIDEMTALAPTGKRIAVRPGMATAVDSWSAYEEGQILKIASSTDTDASILGLFNIAEGQRDALIPLSDITGVRLEGAGKWAVRSYSTGQIFIPEKAGIMSLVKVKLQNRGWDVLSAYPNHEVFGGEVAVLGLINKISGAAAVTMCEINQDKIELELKALGNLGVVLTEGVEVKEIAINQQAIGEGFIKMTDIGENRTLYIIDVEAFWSQSNLWAKNKTVSVTVILSGK